MMKVVILGTGNLANHLFHAFLDAKKISIVQMVGRDMEQLKHFSDFVPITTNFGNIKDADVYIISVKDAAIKSVSAHLSDKKGLVVHTSGATDMDAIKSSNRGVFYPLQTFSRDRTMLFDNIPIGIETENPSSLKLLKNLAASISNKVVEINSQQRKKMHLAAVFANNFTNHLYQIASEICETNGLPFDLLKPLILETAEKVQTLPPYLAQTGPAKRGDSTSMKAHLELLDDNYQKEIYQLLSKSIQESYEKEL